VENLSKLGRTTGRSAMEVRVGPFDPAAHVRSRDHFEGVRREAQLVALAPDATPKRLEALIARLERQFPSHPVDEIADRAYQAGQPSYTAVVSVPDELVEAALAAFDELEALLEELDRWAVQADLPPAPEDVRAYRAAYLAQAREQLRRAPGAGASAGAAG
jgi:uncharacterized protein (DUF934 family)